MPTLRQLQEEFKLTYELAVIEHLGLNLYSEVHSAISELVANAYDAEANNVSVTLPIGVQLGLSGQKIIVKDDGHGMTYEECKEKFLRIGLNRRRQSSLSKNKKRKVIGKKGIGKLAGFGIAEQITVSTVSHGELTEFVLSLSALASAPAANPKEAKKKGPEVRREYRPRLIKAKAPTTRKNGTTVTLENLRTLDPINLNEFKQRLSRKFAVFGQDFKVTLVTAGGRVKNEIAKFDVPTQFRFPSKGWATDYVATPNLGNQKVVYWIGFTRNTIKDDAVRGISVVANGKSVQEPFEFKVTGGTTGQFGMQYITGEVHADWLDDTKVDVIASDRSAVRWSDLDAYALLKWGQQKVKDLLEEWVELRAKDATDTIRVKDPDIYAHIEGYKGEAYTELRRVVDRVVSTMSHVGVQRTREVVRQIVMAYSHEYIRTVLKRVLDSGGDWSSLSMPWMNGT
jgi:hypothetical protein